MVVVLGWVAYLLRTVEWSLVLTAAYVLVLPIPRQKTQDYFRSHELVGEVAEDALRTLSQSKQAVSWADVLEDSLLRHWSICPQSPSLPGLAFVGPIAAVILAAAEAYDTTRITLGTLPRSISYEDIEREFMKLTGTIPDPNIVPVLLSVAETTKVHPLS